MKWYVIRVVSGKEKKTREAIEEKIKENNNQHVISNLLIPSQKTTQLRNGKKVSVDKVSFPGYIFVECESIDDVEANVKHINGVASVLKQQLTSLEIERLLGKQESKPENEGNLCVNQKVKIVDGPFNTLIGTIKDLDIPKQKTKVSVLIFGREVMVDLSFLQVANID